MPKVEGILETAILVEDLKRSLDFYQALFNFKTIASDPGRLVAKNVSDRQVLLLAQKGASKKPVVLPGGTIPANPEDKMHVAFSIAAAELALWEKWLQEKGVPIESKVNWDEGNQSLYFRDPDRNSLELITVPGAWGIF